MSSKPLASFHAHHIESLSNGGNQVESDETSAVPVSSRGLLEDG